MPIDVFLRASPSRAIALATDRHLLIFRHSPSAVGGKAGGGSSTSLNEGGVPKCIVEWSPWESQDMKDYRRLSSTVQGTLGLVTLNGDVFLCVVNGSRKVATVRPGESVQVILSVEFHCLNRSDYDHLLHDQINPFPADELDVNGYEYGGGHGGSPLDHPCTALKKLLSGGSFYYSTDFDLTKRVQDRPAESSTVAIDSLGGGFLWNGYMIQPLVDFRSKLSSREKSDLDHSGILTSAIRGYAATVTVPAASSPARMGTVGMPSTMTIISRLSSRRAGTRFNARGIDDNGNVANFSETETIFTTDSLCYSYVQCRGSVPLFWEQQVGLPGQQKISILGSPEASQHAFNKHFERLAVKYGDVVVVNLLSEEKVPELQLTRQYMAHIDSSPLNYPAKSEGEVDHKHLTAINYDFHAATKGIGYEAASGIKRYLMDSAHAIEYYLSQDMKESITKDGRQMSVVSQNDIVKQNGAFRTNCLDCLDRTNVAQTIISKIAFSIFLEQYGDPQPTSDFWARHDMLWADNGDALAKIYTGTGALKTSFTRSGKTSLAGALADFRKSAQRLYINTVEDKGRQVTIDMLLGRLIGQTPVHLYDPINDYVTSELSKRAAEFTSTEKITIWVGTFNLNGKTHGIDEDLSPWLCPAKVEKEYKVPHIVAVAFQEIVDLDVQQIMSTDPDRRKLWEKSVRNTLNRDAQKYVGEDYVLLRGGQLVGASLSVFVRASALPFIKNVEGAVKKTGLSGMAGNKGAVAIRMDYADTSICLVTAHLAAGFQNYDERNQDYRTIANGIRFQRGAMIENHDSILWFGDFNYRIGMENDRVRQLIRKGDLGSLYENDQLNINMVHGKCFPHYSEQPPKFLPTYKFDLRSDEYDSSDKARIPAWCDRILTRGNNLRQMHYESAPLKFSDHRPVWGLFSCTVSVVDQGKREEISSQLYSKRRAIVGSHLANNKGMESDDESLYGYEAVEPGLPPASSDKRKWWLDNGNPARSTIQPPGPGAVLNPARPSNPFTPTNEPDWVTVEKPNTPQEAPSVSRKPAAPSSVQQSGDLPTAFKTLRPANVDGTAEQKSHSTTVPRKPAPPPKPNNLRSSSPANSVASSREGGGPPPPLPEPRRSNTGRVAVMPPPPPRVNSGGLSGERKTVLPPPPPLRKAVAVEDGAPKLPPRKGAELMDEGDGEIVGWEPLKPQ